MFKKTCLILSFAALSLTASENGIDKVSVIKNRLEHIAQEKRVVAAIGKQALITYKKAIPMAKVFFKEEYSALKVQIKQVLDTIVASDEFSYSINRFTDYQMICIAEKLMTFNSITSDPSEYPIDKKINQELSQAFPGFDQNLNALFNIFYVTLANCRGSQMLLEKLAIKEEQLVAEITLLESQNNIVLN